MARFIGCHESCNEDQNISGCTVIVLQGIVGSLPWTAMVFFTMWFELIGFDNNNTAALLSLFAVGSAMGSFLGELIADSVSKVYPHTGIMCAQFSAIMSIPFSWFFRVIPQSVSSWHVFNVTLFIMGLMISWCATCANNPMFAEVVPAKDWTMIYAHLIVPFEGSFSSFAAPAVGMLSPQINCFRLHSVAKRSQIRRSQLSYQKRWTSHFPCPNKAMHLQSMRDWISNSREPMGWNRKRAPRLVLPREPHRVFLLFRCERELR